LLETKTAAIRLFLQIWDSQDGAVIWEGSQELTLAYESLDEEAVIPYKGAADAANDLLAGRVQLMFDAATTAIQNVNTGKLRMLGVVAETRSPFLPDVPTLTEQGLKGIDLVGWLGWYGPAKMPSEIVARLNAALVKALADPKVKDDYGKGAYEALSSSPAELGALTRDSYERWGKIIRDMGIKPQ